MEPLAYTLRPATAADAAFIYQLRVDGLREHVARIWGWNEAVQAARFARSFAAARYRVIVVADRDVGAVAIEWGDDDAVLADIEIAPAWRGRGLGTAIIGAILHEAQERGLPVTLQVLRGNPARRLYERLGFRIVGETESHDQMRALPERRKSRLIVLDPLGRVLLFHVNLGTGDPFWITPGGELHAGESYEDAARRELQEETGFDDLPLGSWIWEQEQVLRRGARSMLLRERYYLVRAGTVDRVIRHDRRTAEEVALLDEDRWWTIDELRGTRDRVYPPRLAALLAPIVRGQIPPTPSRI